WKIVTALRVLLRFGRPVRRTAWIAVVEYLAFRHGRSFRRDSGCAHAGWQARVPIAARRASRHAKRKKDRACNAGHGRPLVARNWILTTTVSGSPCAFAAMLSNQRPCIERSVLNE